MRLIATLLSLSLSLLFAPVQANTIYAAIEAADPPFERDTDICPEGPAGGIVGYVGGRQVCADVLTQRLWEARGLEDGATEEIVLLTSRPDTRTLYRVGKDREAILSLGNLIRPTGQPLAIRGQLAGNGEHLIWFKGLDLIDTICDPMRVFNETACRDGVPLEQGAGPSGRSWDRRYDMTSTVLIEDARAARQIERTLKEYSGVTGRGPRAYCVRLRRVSGVVLSDMAFEDCWSTAVLLVNSRHVTVAGARIHGSTFGVLALATAGLSADNHTFRVSNSHWIQSPGAYRTETLPCSAPHLDLGCAVDVWDDLPWGVSHHHLWRPLNGGIFAAYNIAGNVLISDNVLERAFNGVRIISEAPRTGRNVTIAGNTFRFLRDNAVEPEERAEGWIVKHNRFENVHAWISTDGVAGSGLYIFGNTATYDPEQMPGSTCSDAHDWARSPFFVGMAGDEGRYVLLDVSHDPTSVACRGHFRGAVLKVGDKRKQGFPYFERISIFHNTWHTRSPLLAQKHASPLSHFNNLIAFTGCGLEGPWDCKQIPAPEEYCQAGNKRTRGRVGLRQFWTDDGQALVADCMSMTPGPAVPDDRALETYDVSHVFCRDVFNRRFGGFPYAEDRCSPIYIENSGLETSVETGGALASPLAGCRLDIVEGAVLPDCSGFGAWIGALQANGRPLDLDIPGAGFLGVAFRP